jgi:hypothetical protein
MYQIDSTSNLNETKRKMFRLDSHIGIGSKGK